MARTLLFHLWNRSWSTVGKKTIHLWQDDDGYLAEWSGDGGRDDGVRRFTSQAEAVTTIWQWTKDAGDEWKDIA